MSPARRTHVAILRDVERLNARIRKATEQMNVALGLRRDLYLEARNREDPVPFSHIAAAAGTTEAAVMQVVKKAQLQQEVTAS